MNFMEITASNGWTEILLDTATLSVAIANRTGLSAESVHRFLVKRPTLLKRSHGTYITEGSARVCIGHFKKRSRLTPEAIADLYEMVWLIENPTPGLSREELKIQLFNFK